VAILVGRSPRFRAARLIVVAVFAVSCGGTATASPIPSQPTPTPTAAAAIVPPPASTIPPPNSCVSLNGLPDRACTPGATNTDVTQATISITICVTGYAAQIRPAATYTNSLKIDHMRAYGYAAEAPGDFEEDHLIALELGGDPRDPKNLWPDGSPADPARSRRTASRTGRTTRSARAACSSPTPSGVWP